MESFSNGHALLIGVGADLPNTVDDALGLADILADPSRCAYPPAQVVALTSATATRNAVLSALDDLAKRSSSDATVVVFFSGHGYRVSSSTGQHYFLMPYGYDVDALYETAISDKEFADRLKAIPAQRMLVLLDCCHAGGLSDTKSAGLSLTREALPPEAQSLFAQGSGRVSIASSRADELSYAGRPYSAFTAALIESLSGEGTAKKDGFVRWADLALHAREKVPQRTKQRQHPIIELRGADNFVLGYYAGGDTEPKGVPFSTPLEIEPTPGAFNAGRDLQNAGRDIINAQGSQGFIHHSKGPVTQHFGARVQTGGGAYVGGSVATGGGAFTGRDAIQQGIGAADLDRIFAPLLDLVGTLAPGERAAAHQAAQELKREAAKGSEADDSRMAKLIDGLVQLVPAAVSAVSSIFATPVLSGIAGNVTKYVLDRIQSR